MLTCDNVAQLRKPGDNLIMMNANEIKRQAEEMSLVQARATMAASKARISHTSTDAEWETLIAAERVLAKWGELVTATYNED